MVERIEKIEEFADRNRFDSRQDGVRITTNKQEIILAIQSGTQCCETWGYFLSEDDPSEFIGAELLDVKLTDDCLNEAHFERAIGGKLYEGGVMFVNLETDRGTLQFTAYNEHNGYYSHEATVKCEQLEASEFL